MSEPTPPHAGSPGVQITVPEEMKGGVWSNFAAVSHSPYEFTIDFVRVDYAHPAPDGARQGQVVARVNLSPLMVTQLMEALETNWQKYAAHSLPREVDGDA